MKVKMLEDFQGREIVGLYERGSVHEVTDDLGAYLLMHRKAEKVEEVPPFVDEPITEPTPPAPVKKRGKK